MTILLINPCIVFRLKTLSIPFDLGSWWFFFLLVVNSELMTDLNKQDVAAEGLKLPFVDKLLVQIHFLVLGSILGWEANGDQRSYWKMPYWSVWNKILMCPAAQALGEGQRQGEAHEHAVFYFLTKYLLEDGLAFIQRQGSWWQGLWQHVMCNTGCSTVGVWSFLYLETCCLWERKKKVIFSGTEAEASL